MNNGFATLDRARPVDPVEGMPDEFVIEFRSNSGNLVDRIKGMRADCIEQAKQRGFAESDVRITGRAQK